MVNLEREPDQFSLEVGKEDLLKLAPIVVGTRVPLYGCMILW